MLLNYTQTILVAQEQRKDILRNANRARLAQIAQCGKTRKWWRPFGHNAPTACEFQFSRPLLSQCQIGECPK